MGDGLGERHGVVAHGPAMLVFKRRGGLRRLAPGPSARGAGCPRSAAVSPLLAGPQRSHLERYRRVRRQVVESQVPAAVLVLEGGADAGPEALLHALALHDAEECLGVDCHDVISFVGFEAPLGQVSRPPRRPGQTGPGAGGRQRSERRGGWGVSRAVVRGKGRERAESSEPRARQLVRRPECSQPEGE